MPPMCIRCALRLRIAESRTSISSKRSFSSTPAKRKAVGALPKFTETSQPELDDVLASLRYKHLLPAALSNTERNLIYKPKYKQQLIDNPEIVTIGNEDIQLEHINRLADVPSLTKDVLPTAINLMAKGEGSDWNQLPSLLAGLKKAKLTPRYEFMGKIARKAIEKGRFGIILQCLHQASITEMRLSKPEILNNVIYALRHMAMNDDWSEKATARAIRDANEVAMLLEDEEHGTGKFVRHNDPRARPHVLAVFLELSAVYAYKYQDGKDFDGKVKTYAERLMSNIKRTRAAAAEELNLEDAKAVRDAEREAREVEKAASKVEKDARTSGDARTAEHVKLWEEANEPLKAARKAVRQAQKKRKELQNSEEIIRVKAGMQSPTTTPRPTGPQLDILRGVPIYHGLRLAQLILGPQMPEPGLAQSTANRWARDLEKLTEELQVQAGRKEKEGKEGEVKEWWPKSDTYPWQAMRVWRSCLDLGPLGEDGGVRWKFVTETCAQGDAGEEIKEGEGN